MIAPNAHLPIPATSRLGDVRCCGGDDSKPAFCAHGEPMNFLIRQGSIFVALLVGHGCENSPIANLHPGAGQNVGIVWLRHRINTLF